MDEKLKSILDRARAQAEVAEAQAEALHDDIGSEYYMDSVQYEIMVESRKMIEDIDSMLGIEKPTDKEDDYCQNQKRTS